MNNEKKYIRSKIAILCYVLAAVMLVYVCYTIGTTIKTINDYYAQYEMSAQPSEYLTYILQSTLDPLIHAFTFFMFGFIVDTVRKNNPANFMTAEEIEEARIAKKDAKEAKKLAKTDSAVSGETSVAVDFVNDLDRELKADAKPAAPKKQNRSNAGRSQNRQGSGRNGGKPASEKSEGKQEADKAAGKKDAEKSAGKQGADKNAAKSGNAGANRSRKSSQSRPKRSAKKPEDKGEKAEKAEKKDAPEQKKEIVELKKDSVELKKDSVELKKDSAEPKKDAE